MLATLEQIDPHGYLTLAARASANRQHHARRLPGLLATSAVMNLFMLGRYEEAAERASRTVTTNSPVPFYSLLPLLAAALERSGRYAKAQSLVDDFRVRNPDF